MKLQKTLVAAGTLMVAMSVGGWTVEAGQRDREGRDRNGRSSQGSSERRGDDGGAAQRREGGQDRGSRAQGTRPDDRPSAQRERESAPPQVDGSRERRQAVPRYTPSDRERANADRDRANNDRYRADNDRYRADNDRYRADNDRYRADRDRYRVYRDRDDYYRYAPRVYRPAPRRYYGPGGNYSVYFGWGSGYLYGSQWSGRVYGYRAPYAYGARIYYGDVRLMVQPRDAAVYVDGYYAGVVDNFDGVFQRLTLEVGPHTIELEAPGLEPQVYEVYVDPLRTTTIRTDLFR
ncbi:MAG: PEGA domain-containing protein [Vicinamibacterales bacterium]